MVMLACDARNLMAGCRCDEEASGEAMWVHYRAETAMRCSHRCGTRGSNIAQAAHNTRPLLNQSARGGVSFAPRSRERLLSKRTLLSWAPGRTEGQRALRTALCATVLPCRQQHHSR